MHTSFSEAKIHPSPTPNLKYAEVAFVDVLIETEDDAFPRFATDALVENGVDKGPKAGANDEELMISAIETGHAIEDQQY